VLVLLNTAAAGVGAGQVLLLMLRLHGEPGPLQSQLQHTSQAVMLVLAVTLSKHVHSMLLAHAAAVWTWAGPSTPTCGVWLLSVSCQQLAGGRRVHLVGATAAVAAPFVCQGCLLLQVLPVCCLDRVLLKLIGLQQQQQQHS
jgi:hypothetical protein